MIRLLALAALLGLQGCVVPAAMEAMHRWDSYQFITARQIDESHFRVVIETDHKRGEFDVLGSHGSHIVVRSIDVELWYLTVTEQGVKAKKEDALRFDPEQEAGYRYRGIRRKVELDMAHGRLALLQVIENGTRAVGESSLRVDADGQMVRGLVNGRTCALPLPPFKKVENGYRNFDASDSGGHIMVTDGIGDVIQSSVVLDVCDPNAPRQAVQFPFHWTMGFSVGADGGLQVIRGRRWTLGSPSANAGWSFEAQVYPGPERLVFTEQDMGDEGKRLWAAPEAFLFDAQTRRFHWVILPESEGSRFTFVTHDFVSGKTLKREFSLKDS